MSYRGWFGKTVENPRGAWSLLAGARRGNPSRASIAQNVRISPGVVETRPGTSSVLAVGGKVTGLYNWLTPITDGVDGNIVLYQEGTDIKRMRISDGQVDTLISSIAGARAPSFADLGPWIYIADYGTDGYGKVTCKVHDGAFTSGTPDVDTAFRGPITLTGASPTDGGAGQCTAGTHYLGVVFQSRSGFSTRPTTTVGGTPISITLGSDARTIHFNFSVGALTDAGPGSFVYPIMTRADNPNKWYFVPGVSFTLPYNVSSSPNMLISITDEDLAASADPADDQFNVLVDGDGAPIPSFVVAYGRRMCYGSGTKLYVSDVNDPQSIAEDLNVIELPNKRKIGMAFPMPGETGLFLTGDKWTGRTTDNGDNPVTWVQPTTISEFIGAPFPACVEFRTAGAYAWIASEAGLYVFTGTYPNHPITYLFSDQWQRINWAAAYAVKVCDDVVNLKCYVAAPLDGATEPTHLFVIDYTNGITYDTCDITLDNFPSTFSSVGIVKEGVSNRSEVWIGPSAAGNIVHFDDATHNDQGAAVHGVWESGLIRQPGEIESNLVRVGGAHLWIRGNGTLIQTWYNLDRTISVQPALLSAGCTISTLTPNPGQEYVSKFDLSPVENATARFDVNEVNGWFRLSTFRAYMKPSLYTR